MHDDEDEGLPEKSKLAQEIERLKTVTIKATKERERLPQPLFWALFKSKLKELKDEKHNKRVVDEVLGKLG